MLSTIAVVSGLWSIVVLFGLSLAQAASRADEEIARQLRLRESGRRTLHEQPPDTLRRFPPRSAEPLGRPDDPWSA